MARRTGKAGALYIQTTAIPITKVSTKFNVAFADSTDSAGYVPTTATLYKSQLPGDSQLELSIEGFWDSTETPTYITGLMKNPSAGPFPMIVNIDSTIVLCSGNFDLTDVSIDETINDANMITFSATAKSNGPFTLN